MSGPGVAAVAARVAPGPLLPRTARRARIVDATGAVLDDGLALYFPGPRSATGEDVLELHLHGSPIVVETVMEALFAAGARAAGPGEFTKRAFLNGKLALHEAEAVGDLIAAEHRSAARAAAARLGGAVSRAVEGVAASLRAVLEEIAGAIDYPDEVPDPDPSRVARAIAEASAELDRLVRGSTDGIVVREGARTAIVGPPNAGKSSLLNALLEEERALVSPVAGTTRDTIEEAADLGGVLVRLIDTAGIRAGADAIEAAGIARTRRALEAARLIVVVLDGSRELDAEARETLHATRGRDRVVFYNKADLGTIAHARRDPAEASALCGSVHRAADVAAVRAAMRAALVGERTRVDLERPALVRARERDAARGALAALDAARATLADGQPIDLLSTDLLEAIAELGKITGATAREETVEGVFARFCVGK